jgi:DNA processing protein
MDMMDRGGIISECPIGASPVAGNFPRRNRIISGLCDGILVVEARKKSGSLITVDIALEQGKEIYTIPGAISSSLSEGCNNIIKLGAKVVTSVDDILEDFSDFIYRRNLTLKDSNLTDELETDSKKSKIFLESKEKIVYASLCFESKHIDDIVCETGLSIGEVIKILFGLEEKNLVVQTQSNYYERLNMG